MAPFGTYLWNDPRTNNTFVERHLAVASEVTFCALLSVISRDTISNLSVSAWCHRHWGIFKKKRYSFIRFI